MDPQLDTTLKATLDALERVMNYFRVERVIHLILSVVAFLMLLYAMVLLFTREKYEIKTDLLVALFGSSGLIAVSSARITYFLNKSFSLIENVINVILKSGRVQ